VHSVRSVRIVRIVRIVRSVRSVRNSSVDRPSRTSFGDSLGAGLEPRPSFSSPAEKLERLRGTHASKQAST
jgi:hypothetical protein